MQSRNGFGRMRGTWSLGLVALLGCAGFAARAGAADTAHDATTRGGGLVLDVTLSVDPPDPEPGYDSCGSNIGLTAYTGDNVRWCYEITNNTGVTLTRHDLASSRFGAILSNFSFSLMPGAKAFITRVEDAVGARVETATWTSYNPGPVDLASDADSASLSTETGIELEVTLSIDPVPLPPMYDACGSETTLAVPPGRDVRWCYQVRLLGNTTRTRHTLQSTRQGTILDDFAYDLLSGNAAFITRVETMGETRLTESATWTAYRPGPVNVSTDRAGAVANSAIDIFANGFEG
jgi:hypothetical protein